MKRMSAAVPHAPTFASVPRLLLIDDSPQELSQLTQILAERYRLLYATEGWGGFHRAQSQRPDLILLDVEMPDLNGHAVCRLLRAERSTQDIPVIFLSAYGDPLERLEGLNAGAVDYIAKPCLAEEVVARIKVHLHPGSPEPAEAADSSADPALMFVRAARTLVRQQIAALPSVGRLAQQLGLSERRLSDLFREHLGMTVSAFISDERIRVGCSLLTETVMPVGEVSAEVGFVSAASFSAAFRERMGMTPQAWRKLRRGQGDKA